MSQIRSVPGYYYVTTDTNTTATVPNYVLFNAAAGQRIHGCDLAAVGASNMYGLALLLRVELYRAISALGEDCNTPDDPSVATDEVRQLAALVLAVRTSGRAK